MGPETRGLTLGLPSDALSPVTLRFRDPQTEHAFQLEAGARFRPQVMITVVLGAATWGVTGLLLPLVFPVDPIRVAIAIGVVEAVIAALFFAFRRSRTWDGVQTLSGLVNLVGGVAIIAIGGFVADVPHLVTPALLVNMLFAFGLSRLGVGVAVAITVPYIALFIVLVAAGRLPSVGAFEVFLVLVAAGVASTAGYLLEASSRGLFWQRRLIDRQSAQLVAEKEKSDRLLANMLPDHVARRLRERPMSLADRLPEVSVLFGDLVSFTSLASQLTPDALVGILDELFSRFDDLAVRHGLDKIKTMGDGYMAVAGVTGPLDGHAGRAVAMGLDMVTTVEGYGDEVGLPLALRVGVHSGPVVAGVIGRVRISYDLWGDTVNVASRMQSQGVPGAVQITDATARLVGKDLNLEPVGAVDVRGKGPIECFLIRPRTAEHPEEPSGPVIIGSESKPSRQ